MSSPDTPSVTEQQVQEAAATWFARLRGDRVDAAERARFEAWLAAAPAHGREYALLDRLWQEAGQLGTVQVESGRRKARVPLVKAAVLVAIAGLCGWLAWQDAGNRIETDERRHLMLADGSELDLAPHTRLRVDFDDAGRRLELSAGEIAVRVAADPGRPFEVRTAAGTIRDIGTRFDVLSGHGRVRVTVAEGEVEIALPVAGATQWHRLKAGEAAEFDGTGITPARAADANAAMAWTDGRLVFDGAPLAEVIASLNRHLATGIVLEDPGLAGLRVSGVFRLDDEAALLRTLQAVTPVRFVPEGGRFVARRAAPAQ